MQALVGAGAVEGRVFGQRQEGGGPDWHPLQPPRTGIATGRLSTTHIGLHLFQAAPFAPLGPQFASPLALGLRPGLSGGRPRQLPVGFDGPQVQGYEAGTFATIPTRTNLNNANSLILLGAKA